MADIIGIFVKYVLKVNVNKTKSWYNNVSNGIKMVKTYKYLGIKLRANGKSYDTIGIE